MEKFLIVPIIVGFLVTLFSIPIWIRRAKKAGLVGKDMQKLDKREVAEGGGISVLFGFVVGVLAYIAIKTFVLKTIENTTEIFALLSVVLIVGFVGFVDDILGWKIGLTKNIRILFLIFASIPLIVINAGESSMMGIDFGLFYPLLLIPLGVVGASATFNFVAGYNGLETSQGILVLFGLSLFTWMTGSSWISLIILIFVACLIAFYLFNKYPAKVFPGDVLTYITGAMIAIIAILGNVEKIAIFFFIPYIIETGLKIRGKLKKESFAKLNSEGNLEVPYEKFYGIEHIAIYLLKKYKGVAKEKEVVYLINLFQIIIILLGFILFGSSFY